MKDKRNFLTIVLLGLFLFIISMPMKDTAVVSAETDDFSEFENYFEVMPNFSVTDDKRNLNFGDQFYHATAGMDAKLKNNEHFMNYQGDYYGYSLVFYGERDLQLNHDLILSDIEIPKIYFINDRGTDEIVSHQATLKLISKNRSITKKFDFSAQSGLIISRQTIEDALNESGIDKAPLTAVHLNFAAKDAAGAYVDYQGIEFSDEIKFNYEYHNSNVLKGIDPYGTITYSLQIFTDNMVVDLSKGYNNEINGYVVPLTSEINIQVNQDTKKNELIKYQIEIENNSNIDNTIRFYIPKEKGVTLTSLKNEAIEWIETEDGQGYIGDLQVSLEKGGVLQTKDKTNLALVMMLNNDYSQDNYQLPLYWSSQYAYDFKPIENIPEVAVKKDIYRVEFDTQGGSNVDSLAVTEGNLFKAPNIPIKEGYEFIAWYLNPNLTEIWDFDSNIVETDITLYAGWKEKSYITVEKDAIEYIKGTDVSEEKFFQDIGFNHFGGGNVSNTLAAVDFLHTGDYQVIITLHDGTEIQTETVLVKIVEDENSEQPGSLEDQNEKPQTPEISETEIVSERPETQHQQEVPVKEEVHTKSAVTVTEKEALNPTFVPLKSHLPQTGMRSNYLPYILCLVGFIVIMKSESR